MLKTVSIQDNAKDNYKRLKITITTNHICLRRDDWSRLKLLRQQFCSTYMNLISIKAGLVIFQEEGMRGDEEVPRQRSSWEVTIIGSGGVSMTSLIHSQHLTLHHLRHTLLHRHNKKHCADGYCDTFMVANLQLKTNLPHQENIMHDQLTQNISIKVKPTPALPIHVGANTGTFIICNMKCVD